MVRSNYRQLNILLDKQSYPVIIGQNVLNDAHLLLPYIKGTQVLIISDTTVAPLYLEKICKVLSAFNLESFIIQTGEVYKSYSTLILIHEKLIQSKFNRDATIVALGGGVVGDIAGFAASLYQRGIAVIQIPTTLLAQVDAAIGGKTAINHYNVKNIVGSFYQPKAVFIDLNTLISLPARIFNSGMGEVIKYALLSHSNLFDKLSNALEQKLFKPPSEILADIIHQCCSIKIYYIQQDPNEQNIRAFLNLGHTFAHALESYTNYQHWLHGEAVGIGLHCMALLSYRLGCINYSTVNRIKDLLVLANLPINIPKNIDLTTLKSYIRQDKKVHSNGLNFILLKKIGVAYIENNVSEKDLDYVFHQAVETSR